MLRCHFPAFLIWTLAAAHLYGQRDHTWRQDIDTYARELPARHANLFHDMTREQFDTAVRELSDNVPRLGDGEIVAGLLRITAMAKDAHMAVFHNLNILPVEVMWMREGLFISAASREYVDLIGARVLKFESLPAEEALERVKPLFFCENASRIKARSASALTTTPLLFAQGVVASPAKATLDIEMPDGTTRTIELGSVPAGARSTMVPPHRAPDGYVPLAFRDPATPYWYEYLPAEATVYLAFNHSREDFAGQFTSFANRMASDLAGRKINQAVIDLRHNTGGVPAYFESIVAYIKDSEFRSAKFYGIIGRNTFSAGMFHAWQLQQELGATLIGEPTGGRPWGWGYVGQFGLPYSRLTVQYSTQQYKLTPDDRDAVEPDIAAEPTAAEYFRRFDAWFAMALAGGARRGSLRIVEVVQEDGALVDSDHRLNAGAVARIRIEGELREDAIAVFGHTQAIVLENIRNGNRSDMLVRVPEELRGDTPLYVVSGSELSNATVAALAR